MRKLLLIIFALITFYGHSQTLRAIPDTFTVLQANVDTFYVTNNDSIPIGDSICITLIDTGARFSILNCRAIIYKPDSFFTGRDTCRYALCDTAGICDTAMVVIYLDTNRALLPVASFKDDSLYGYSFCGDSSVSTFFDCNNICGIWAGGHFQLSSISKQSDSIHWKLRDIDLGHILYDTTKYFWSDTISFVPALLWDSIYNYNSDTYNSPENIEICLIAYNRFGVSMICDTSCDLIYPAGITEVPLSNIKLYPSPADKILTIDMSRNNDLISSNYTAIMIYNTLGQKVRSVPRHGSSKIIEISVADLPDGVYLSTIIDGKGQETVLEKFTVDR